jgi:hypothetical protein
MTFKDQLAIDARQVFLNTDEHAEMIAYTPYGGTSKDIKAVVSRRGIEPGGEDSGRVLRNQVEILIANDADEGVIAVNKGGDVVALQEREGGVMKNWRVLDIINQDAGMWHLLLQG